MNTQKRIVSFFMVLSLFIGMLSSSMNVFAVENNIQSGENDAGIYEATTTLSDNKQNVDVDVVIHPKENVSILSVILPYGDEKDFSTNTIEFQMTENGQFSLGVDYQLSEVDEVKKAEIPITISGIEKN